jgi:hypothetical protein
LPAGNGRQLRGSVGCLVANNRQNAGNLVKLAAICVEIVSGSLKN